MMRIALAGNQNSGKTTLFNHLTGEHQHVGNWPGVTVERKEGTYRHDADMAIIDLPGVYSLSSYSFEEMIAREYLLHEKPDVIINIVDAANLERNLYLTLQLLQLKIPMVMALNMMDEVQARGDRIDAEELARGLRMPVLPICARTGEGIEQLMDAVCQGADRLQTTPAWESQALRRGVQAMTQLVSDKAKKAGMPANFAACKLLEDDEQILRQLCLASEEVQLMRLIRKELARDTGMSCAAAVADARYAWIETLLKKGLTLGPRTIATRTDKIDGVVMHPVLAIPIFMLAMLLCFWITFGPVGSWIDEGFSLVLEGASRGADALLARSGTAYWLRMLLVEGVMDGVGSVVSFMPVIVLLFMCLSILEDSGYMARAAFVMDAPMRKIGLSGRGLIPLLMGFGCTVPAVMAARSMNSLRDRRFAILLTPFMSCGAKMPVYVLFALAFFPEHAALVTTALYLGGVVMAAAVGSVLKRTAFPGEGEPFVMEMPPYRMPTCRNVVRSMMEHSFSFMRRAFTVVFLSTVIVCLMQQFDFRLTVVDDIHHSMLGILAGFAAPVFAPLGFGSMEAATAVLTGVMAKESIVSTLAVMAPSLQSIFPSTASAISFLTFVLLYMPCVAACSAIRRELQEKGGFIAWVVGQTGLAWGCAWVVYRLCL